MSAPTSLADELLSQLQGDPMQQLASRLGTSTGQTESAVSAALPLLLGALGRNAAEPQEAAGLLGALKRDHAGNGADLSGLLGALLGGAGDRRATDGTAILGHIFGGDRQRVESGLGQATGLGTNAGQLLQLLAPIVMAFLARRAQAGGLDANGLGQVLGQERARAAGQGGLLGQLLDSDGDGRLGVGDLIKIGGSLLGGRR